MRIRTYLLIFAMVILVPMIVFSAIAVVAFDRQQRAAVERGGVETARALMHAVDRELTGSIATLQALATARSLERGDLAGFQEDAGRVLATQRHWTTIILISPAGERVIDVATPVAGPPRPIAERESFELVMRTAAPAIGPMVFGTLRQRFGFAVRVPVMRGNAVAYVLTGVVEPSEMAELLRQQQIPADWVGAVFDARRTVVARTRGKEQFVGGQISPEFARALDAAREGWTLTHTLEGTPVYTAFSRSPTTGWGVGLGIPPASVDGPLRRSLWLIAGGGLAFLVCAVALSALVGRRIAGPVVALSARARSFGSRSDDLAVPRHGPQEVVAVARALADALTRERRARADAEAASRAKDEFLAVLSHELRTPLNAVYGWARMLRSGGLDAAASARGLDVIERNAAAQVRLIEDLLDISRIVAGKMHLELRPVDLPAVIEAALDSVRPAAIAKDLTVRAQLDPAAARIFGDPDRLQQVVWNLLSNAIKFTPGPGRIDIALRRAGAEVELRVSDTGRGIARDLLPYVFDRFRQADSTSTRVVGGLGLGLSLVRHLVELHGGTVEAASAGDGQGATFIVRLPVRPVATEDDGVAPTASSAAERQSDGEA